MSVGGRASSSSRSSYLIPIRPATAPRTASSIEKKRPAATSASSHFNCSGVRVIVIGPIYHHLPLSPLRRVIVFSLILIMTERLRISRLAHRGDGLAETAAGPLYVPYALPGETVEVDPVPGHPDR